MSEHKPGQSRESFLPGPPPATGGDAAPKTATSPARAKVAPKKKTATATAEPKDSFREIVETVVFVVVLVLLLKSFVAEAFVIPTGSMAETLYGYQRWMTCPECGHGFPVNCSSEIEDDPQVDVTGCRCPNCLLSIDIINRSPSCRSGDRVLVEKFAYDSHLPGLVPKPFDVVVFKFPEGPLQKGVAMNYIKRLIGLPGQTVGIYYGDLYVADDIEYPKEPLAKEADLPERRRLYRDYEVAKNLLESGDKRFRILRKPPDKILNMMRPVYINDEQAKDLRDQKFPPRWAPETDLLPHRGNGGGQPDFRDKRKWAEIDPAWVADNAHGFKHAGREGPIDWLRYRHLLLSRKRGWADDRERVKADIEGVKPELIKDLLGYNTGIRPRLDKESSNWVGDLILECNLTVEQAEGEIVFELSKGVERFQARWDLPSGVCTLVRKRQDGTEEEMAKKETAVKKPGSYRLRFANVDQRLTVWVDRTLPFGDGVDYEAPTNGGKILRGAWEPNDLEPASIGVRGAGVSVRELKLFRDIYYTNPSAANEAMTLYVQPGHYLCLGDNSPQSSDSRSWGSDQRGGLVPEHLMLGRALWVYWPPSRFGPIK